MVSLKSSATTVEHQPEQQASFCTLLILPEHESPGWLLTLITMLQPAYIIDTIIQSQPILPDQLPDVCIAAELTDTVLNLFESLEHQTTIAPLRVLVTEDFDHPALNTCVDMVFPPIPRYINHQLPKVLHAHKERIHLQGQILALTRAVQLLQNKLAIEKKSVEELVLLKNAIVRNVSHELRTPLLQVKSAVSLLAEEAPGSTLAGYAQDSTARLEAVVKNIAQLADSIDDMNISVMLVRECAEYAVLNLRRLWRHKDDIERIQLDTRSDYPRDG
jgi:signal transduction histidine kinase